MQFGVTLKADFETDVDGDNLVSTYDVDADMLGISGNANISVDRIGGSVHIEGTIEVEDFEVSASDLSGFDAESALDDEYGNLSLSSAEFEVTASPTGFVEVESALGDREQAIEVYAALANAGFEVV